ncbi:TPA: hypothetical protein O5T86_001251 [Staphylococcus aureus]|nr:hypothetical protein [Staphylococcus aureus]HDA7217708.1 hypothetical protein [Staphylococcus aureus]HDA7234987.1 hypothetical protein [Staphylococcus aureus]HDA7236790.1 hypothetical protein [Staphylococcus aureus]HDA7239215.1 hypothetical protein [Staphylococcus aureus]
MSRTPRIEEVQTERRRRTGLGPDRNLKLHVPEEAKDPNFVYRWVNNRPGRVMQLTQMDDYEVVSSEDGKIDRGTTEGTVVKRTVNRSEGDEAVLVRKPRAYYEADKAEEQKLIDAADEDMRNGASRSSEGLSGSEAYVPGGRKGQSGRNVVSGK